MPALEAWEKVIITGSNGNRFLSSSHGPNYAGTDHHPLKCQHCHRGKEDRTFANKDEAHTGLIADPSAPGEVACKDCHTSSAATSAVRRRSCNPNGVGSVTSSR